MLENKQLYPDYNYSEKKKFNILFTYLKTTYDYKKVNKKWCSIFLSMKNSVDPGASK